MDNELRHELLLCLRPSLLMDSETLFEALDVGREAFILTVGNLEVWRFENQVALHSILEVRISAKEKD
jgi:hypothetical protein